MADYYDKFSFVIPRLSDEEKAWLEENTVRIDECEGCKGAGQYDSEDNAWWFHDGNTIYPDETCDLIQKFLKKFRPKDEISFGIAQTCSKPRLYSFGGLAIVISARSIRSFSTNEWIAKQLGEGKL